MVSCAIVDLPPISTRSARGGGDVAQTGRQIAHVEISTRSARGGGDAQHPVAQALDVNFNPLRPWGRRLNGWGSYFTGI